MMNYRLNNFLTDSKSLHPLLGLRYGYVYNSLCKWGIDYAFIFFLVFFFNAVPYDLTSKKDYLSSFIFKTYLLRNIALFAFGLIIITLSLVTGVTPLFIIGLLLINNNVVTFILKYNIITFISKHPIMLFILYWILVLFGLDLILDLGHLYMSNNGSSSNFSGISGNGNGGNSNMPSNNNNHHLFPHQRSDDNPESATAAPDYYNLHVKQLDDADKVARETRKIVKEYMEGIEERLRNGASPSTLASDFQTLNSHTMTLGNQIRSKEAIKSIMINQGAIPPWTPISHSNQIKVYDKASAFLSNYLDLNDFKFK